MIDSEIERLLDGPPSKLAFRSLCATLAMADYPEDLLAWCEERLVSWPDTVREAPESWLRELEGDFTRPTWSLVRSLTVSSGRLGMLDLVLPDPRSYPEVRGVTHIDLGWFGSDDLERLVDGFDLWENLRALRLNINDQDSLDDIANLDALARIESLSLKDLRSHAGWSRDSLFRPPEGRPLLVRHAEMRARHLIHLLRAGLVPDLRSADAIVTTPGEARELADCAGPARLERLGIRFCSSQNGEGPWPIPQADTIVAEDDEACETFFAHADLTNLRSLTVLGTNDHGFRKGLGARGSNSLVASGVLQRLTEFHLAHLPLGDTEIAHVLGGISGDRIEKLVLVDLAATDAIATTLSGAGELPRLRHLDLHRNLLGERGARHLATQVAMPALEHLDLSGSSGGSPYYSHHTVQPIGDRGVAAWAGSDNAANLRYLNVAATGLSVDGLTALLCSELLQHLETLDLSRNPLGRWPGTIRTSAVWRTLRTLHLAECGVDDDDIEILTGTTAPELSSVSLAYNSVGSRGAAALASWPALPQLWNLDLYDNIIGDDGLIELATSDAAIRLLELDLEQDCWNARRRSLRSVLPPEVLDAESFPSLDSIYLGTVDEYHGVRYFCGFPTRLLRGIVSAPDTRPEIVTFLTNIELVELDETEGEPTQQNSASSIAGGSSDFRARRKETHAERIREAEELMRSLVAPPGS
ncbi:hypothetical protein KO481_26070 [Nocardia sp. NEAU-G5]|uniref:Leucine rich repeat (LRR) protein n=1 Tax=Nocardia albiluteola TaxID=2842303 RepID=A0ABS6B3U3_9NOCA|nr:hypothetical protein [Nocardia albiluteola]MBU3064985.1 hypothetical protein [Nocardia albiluteola]